MNVTLSGIVISSRLSQPQQRASSIFFKPGGSSKRFRLQQVRNAPSAMLVTDEGMSIVDMPQA